MKIVHELNQLDYGGAEKVIRNIIKFDKVNQHQIIAYKDGPYREELEKAGAEILIVKDLENDVEGDADIIHVHSGGDISPMASQLGGAFTVIETIHSPIRSPMGKNMIFRRVGVSPPVTALNSNCQTIMNGLDFSQLGAARSKIEVKAELGIPEGVPVVGRLGRIGLDKGLEEWLLTCGELQKRGLKFVPLIVGGEARGIKGYRGKLKLIAECLPVKGVIWAGHQSEVSDYLQVMDVFLYPSATEGFGLVFIEAMFNECVVVSYDNDVNRSVIGGYSVLTNPKSGINGLAAGVETALSYPLRDEIQSLQMQFILDQYDAQRMSLDYQELYERSYADFNRPVESEAQHVESA